MRTNIELNDSLVEEAFKYSQARTKKDLVHEALREFVENRKRRDLLELKGRIAFAEDYDHKRMRQAK